MTPKELEEAVIHSLEENKGVDVLPLDVRALTEIADFMVLCTGTSKRHVKALAEHVLGDLKEQDIQAIGVEGQDPSEWILIDLGDVIVHVMLSTIREFYDLEKLWGIELAENARNKSADNA